MSLFDGKPIGRIDLYGPKPRGLEIEIAPTMAEQLAQLIERDRIWGLTKRTAEATNIATRSPEPTMEQVEQIRTWEIDYELLFGESETWSC